MGVFVIGSCINKTGRLTTTLLVDVFIQFRCGNDSGSGLHCPGSLKQLHSFRYRMNDDSGTESRAVDPSSLHIVADYYFSHHDV
jgi:hypothetical protein